MVAPGSSLTVLVREEQAVEVEMLAAELVRQRFKVKLGDATDRRTLEALNPGHFQHVITLGDSSLGGGAAPIQAADAHTLVTLLHLRQINQRLEKPFAVVSEMLDPRNRELAEVARADDFIVSDRLVSLVVNQIAENPELSQFWGELLDANGVTIYLRPVEEYVQTQTPTDF
jgi:voltage-gated potassium channel Kch